MLPVLAIKGCRVVDFNGRTIGTISTTTILVNPDRSSRNPPAPNMVS